MNGSELLDSMPTLLEDAPAHFDAMTFEAFESTWVALVAEAIEDQEPLGKICRILTYVRNRYRTAGKRDHRVRYDPEQIRAMYVDDLMTVDEIAALVGRSHTTVNAWLNKLGIARTVEESKRIRREAGKTEARFCAYKLPIKDEQIRQMYESGMGTTKIGKVLGCSCTTIWDRLKKMGVPLRPGKGGGRVKELQAA